MLMLVKSDPCKKRAMHLSRINQVNDMRFSLTALQLRHTMIFFASIPDNCVTGAAAGEKDTFVLG